METTRIVNNSSGTADVWRATDLEFLDFWERSTKLGGLFLAWSELSNAVRSLPRDAEYRRVFAREYPAETVAGDSDRLPEMFIAEPTPGAALEFVISHPNDATGGYPLSILFEPILCDTLFTDLMLCQGTREPMYQQIHQRVQDMERSYVRLLLPTAGGDGDVAAIYGICRPLYAEQELKQWVHG